jgi:hypothetical protein
MTQEVDRRMTVEMDSAAQARNWQSPAAKPIIMSLQDAGIPLANNTNSHYSSLIKRLYHSHLEPESKLSLQLLPNDPKTI